MPGLTPLYSIPYVVGTDPLRTLPATSQAQAEATEAALKNRGATPLASDLVSLVERINALEAASLIPGDGLQGLNGYEPQAGSRFFLLGDLIMLVVNLRKNSGGVTNVNCCRIPAEYAPPASVTFNGIASQGGSAAACTLVLGTTGIVRNWSSSTANTLLSFNLFWKRGA